MSRSFLTFFYCCFLFFTFYFCYFIKNICLNYRLISSEEKSLSLIGILVGLTSVSIGFDGLIHSGIVGSHCHSFDTILRQPPINLDVKWAKRPGLFCSWSCKLINGTANTPWNVRKTTVVKINMWNGRILTLTGSMVKKTNTFYTTLGIEGSSRNDFAM